MPSLSRSIRNCRDFTITQDRQWRHPQLRTKVVHHLTKKWAFALRARPVLDSAAELAVRVLWDEFVVSVSKTRTSSSSETTNDATINWFAVQILDTVSSCDQTVTLNNTYWTSPISPVSATDSTCGLTVKLDARIAEQRRTICQVRSVFTTCLSFGVGAIK